MGSLPPWLVHTHLPPSVRCWRHDWNLDTGGRCRVCAACLELARAASYRR